MLLRRHFFLHLNKDLGHGGSLDNLGCGGDNKRAGEAAVEVAATSIMQTWGLGGRGGSIEAEAVGMEMIQYASVS
jgi:hypothetical protein